MNQKAVIWSGTVQIQKKTPEVSGAKRLWVMTLSQNSLAILGSANLKSSFASAWSLEIWPTWIMDPCWPPWKHFIWPLFLPAAVCYRLLWPPPSFPVTQQLQEEKEELHNVHVNVDGLKRMKWSHSNVTPSDIMKGARPAQEWKQPQEIYHISYNHISWCDMLWLASKYGQFIRTTHAAGSHWCQK